MRAKTFQMRQNIKAFIRRLIINSFQMHIKQIKLTEKKYLNKTKLYTTHCVSNFRIVPKQKSNSTKNCKIFES